MNNVTDEEVAEMWAELTPAQKVTLSESCAQAYDDDMQKQIYELVDIGLFSESDDDDVHHRTRLGDRVHQHGLAAEKRK